MVNSILKRKKNKGFTLTELIIAVGIFGVLSTIIVTAMGTSSETYSSVSSESQMQAEAQVVANAITDITIDAREAGSKTAFSITIPSYNNSSTGENWSYVDSTGKHLCLKNIKDDGSYTVYIIAKRSDKDELYEIVQDYDASDHTVGDATHSLLAQYIDDFNVDLSRYDKNNAKKSLVGFNINYKKLGKHYNGEYQVFMRNRAYSAGSGGPAVRIPKLNSVNLSPSLVYIDVIDNKPMNYRVNSLMATAYDLSSLNFRAAANYVYYNPSSDFHHTWDLKDNDPDLVQLVTMGDGTDENAIVLADSYDYRASGMNPSFKISYSCKADEIKDGETVLAPVTTKSATATVCFRYVKDVTVTKQIGTYTGVKDAWDIPDAEFIDYGISTGAVSGAGCYVKSGAFVNLKGAVSGHYIDSTSNQVTWKLEYCVPGASMPAIDAESGWSPVTDSSIASITAGATGNNLAFRMGRNAKHDSHVFRLTATSTFDPSVKGYYMISVYPDMDTGDDSGYNSRGYYTDMCSYWTQPGYNHPQAWEGDATPTFTQVCFADVSETSGGSNSADTSMFKMFTPEQGADSYRLMFDYDAFSYTGNQKRLAYTNPDSGINAFVVLAGYANMRVQESDGSFTVKNVPVIVGKNRNAYKARAAAAMHINASAFVDCGDYADHFKYQLFPVVVNKITPGVDYIVINKGQNVNIKFQTKYYNMAEPKNGRNYIGAYIDNLNDNLLASGRGDSNTNFTAEFISGYGTTTKYVETGIIKITAKPDNASGQRTYMSEPATLRLTAEDFYRIDNNPDPNSYKDYQLLTANIPDSGIYFPTPKSKETTGLKWPTVDGTEGAKKDISGKMTVLKKDDITGVSEYKTEDVTGKCYKKGTKYYLVYNGVTYTYNPAYRYWYQ